MITWRTVNPNGSDGQGHEALSGRLSLRYKDDSKDIVLRGYASDEDAGGTGVIALSAGPTNALTGIDSRAGLNDRQFNSNRTEDVNLNAKGVNLQAKFDLNDEWKLVSISSWDKGHFDQPVFDWSASPVAIGDLGGDWYVEAEQYQQDLRVSYEGERANLIIGGYYGRDETHFDGFFNFYEELAPLDVFVAAGAVPIVASHEYDQIRTSKAIYAPWGL